MKEQNIDLDEEKTFSNKRHCFQNIYSVLFKPQKQTIGVYTLRNLNFYLSLILYLASFIILAHDPFFCDPYGDFEYRQGIVVLLLSLIISMSLNWEMCIFGNPSGANLFLQIIQMLPFSLFVTRITCVSNTKFYYEKTIVVNILDHINAISNATWNIINKFIPLWITDLFQNWKISILLIIVLFCISLRNIKFKIPSIIFILLISFLTEITKVESTKMYLIVGFVLLAFGMKIQFSRYDLYLYDLNVIHKLEMSKYWYENPSIIIKDTMDYLKNHFSISEKQLSIIVSETYNNLKSEELKIATADILKQMVFKYKLVSIRWDETGFLIFPQKKLWYNDNILRNIAVFPRIILVVFFSIIWILMPLDVVPDAIPVFGVLDDISVTILSGFMLKKTIAEHTDNNDH